MTVLELEEETKRLYAPSARRVDIVDIPEFNFVMIDGHIEPGKEPSTSGLFQDALNVLNGISFTLKFMSKLRKKNPIDYNTMPLEGLWWTEGGELDFNNKDEWQWTLMMMQPAHITISMFKKAVASLRQKRGDIPALDLVRYEAFREGLSMQILHVGSRNLASMTIDRMNDFAHDNGYRLRGLHHEIYLSDPRHEKPEKERTILRRPIKKIK